MGGHFDIAQKKNDLSDLENMLNDPQIWDDAKKANDLNKKISDIRKDISEYDKLLKNIDDNLELASMLTDNEDADLLNVLDNELISIIDDLSHYEVKMLLDGEFDSYNCFLEIHPGAGGTEACDWADMLLRMYSMFATKFGFDFQVIDRLPGEEAGIKSVLVHIKGYYAYGYLRSEIGVHRLVRISPFDSNKRRHTSFAAVNIIPEFESVGDIELNEEDIRVDVYRSSGCGGQGVNTTDSAVRVTHIPTGIVVTCQNERSQIKNKETALNVLKNKLYQREIERRNKEIADLKGNSNIDFGSQIRNYVLEPYSLVKDIRTGKESNMPDKVLDGDIYPFIEAYLRIKR